MPHAVNFARYRFWQRKLRVIKKRWQIRGLIFLIRKRQQAIIWMRRVAVFTSKYIATIAGLMTALVFALTLPAEFLTDPSFKISEVHIACAGIIGTALALVFSLSIVPAQKAADVFSPAILKLYARDRVMLRVFVLLSCATLASILFGTNWTFHLSPRYTLAIQFILLGMALDAIKTFYIRTLNLLVPQTALGLVIKECNGQIERTKKDVMRLLHVRRIDNPTPDDEAALQAVMYFQSQLSKFLTAWIDQLTEFAYKGIARRDTQAVNAAIATIGTIGIKYANARRDSLILLPDMRDLFSGGRSDISDVLNPIYESIRTICQDAAKQSNELIVQHCIHTLGGLTTHAMTMIHTQDRWRRAPLAHSPIFYMDICVEQAIKVGMIDALMTAINCVGQIFAKISNDTDTRTTESQALKCLFNIAAAAYIKQETVSSTKAVEMMLLAARFELRARGYRIASNLTTIFDYIVTLAPFEVLMEKVGKRMMQTFPPYSLIFEHNIPALLEEIARQVKPVDPEQSWRNPFDAFNEASEKFVHHYRELGNKTNFDGTLLEKWVTDSIISAAKVHIWLLDNPPEGGEEFVDSVDNRLRWFIYAPSFFFQETKNFPHHHANDACKDLAILGMWLLERRWWTESAQACAKAISGIAKRCAAAENSEPYSLADLFTSLECLARASTVLGYTQLAVEFRAHIARPTTITEADWPHYLAAINTRIRQMDEELEQFEPSRIRLSDDPIIELRRIIEQYAVSTEDALPIS